MVSWPAQTVAGAIATGTHGSTLMDGSLSSQVPLTQISWTIWKLRSVTQLLCSIAIHSERVPAESAMPGTLKLQRVHAKVILWQECSHL